MLDVDQIAKVFRSIAKKKNNKNEMTRKQNLRRKTNGEKDSWNERHTIKCESKRKTIWKMVFNLIELKLMLDMCVQQRTWRAWHSIDPGMPRS